MRRSDYRAVYGQYSTRASDVARQLCFAGFGIIWIFKAGEESSLSFPHELLTPALCFAIGLAADLLQYVAASVIWGVKHWRLERECASTFKRLGYRPDPNLLHSRFLKYPQFFFFWVKLISTLLGYSWLISYVFGRFA